MQIQLAEDLAQDWIIKKYMTQSLQSLYQCCIDLKRKEFGQKRYGRKRTLIEVEEDTIGVYTLPEVYLIDYSPSNLRQKLSSIQYKVIDLKILGYTQSEIALMLGVTQPRVCQLLKQVARVLN